MIQLVIGKNKTSLGYIQEQKRIHKNLTFHVLYADDFKNNSFASKVAFSKTLFGEQELYLIKNSLSEFNIKEILNNFSDTENRIIFFEEKILKKDRILFEKKEIEIIDFSLEKTIKKTPYNIFILADLLGKRDKKNLWLAYQEALKNASPEEIHGVFFWQIKNLALARWEKGKGMSPFVQKKNLSYAQNFSDNEIQNLSSQMLKIFHQRDSYSTLAIEIEKIILSI